MIDLFELYFYEDCPYEDESVELLGIGGKRHLEDFFQGGRSLRLCR